MSKDPTNTLTIRNKAIAEINRRFKKIIALVRKSILKTGYINNADEFQEKFYYRNDEAYVDDFYLWLQQIIDEIVFDNKSVSDAELIFISDYLKQAYVKGIGVTQAYIKTQQPESTQQGFFPQSNEQRLLLPQHVNRTEQLYTRVYTDLKGVTDTMSTQMRRVLSDGIFQGQGIEKIADSLVDRVEKIGITRAKLIARTEIIRANQVAVIEEGRFYQDNFAVDVYYRWRTSTDERVRDTHRTREGKVYTDKQVTRLIGEPNCRCRVFLVFDKG